MMGVEERQAALEQLQAAFEAQLDDMLRGHAGEFVVFADAKPVGFFPTFAAAYNEALSRFGTEKAFLVSAVAPAEPTPASVSWELGVMVG